MGSLLRSKLLNRKKEEVRGEVALKEKVIVLYFSAQWCPPCRHFTPRLKTFYETVRSRGKNLEIVFISWDRSEKDMWEYFAKDHADYLALPFDSPIRETLGSQYKVSGIPWLTVIKANGDIAVNEADEDVRPEDQQEDHVKTFERWAAASKA